MKIRQIANTIKTIVSKTRGVLNEKYVIESELLMGKNALIIGGGTEIGNAIAERLSCAGCHVVVASRTQRPDNNFDFVQWDVAKENAEEKLEEVISRWGSLDIVVNSQGICPENDFRGKVFEISEQEFDDVMAVNLKSMFFICQAVCRYYINNSISGHILNIASTEGLKGAIVPYGISKSGTISLTKGLGKKMASEGITINGIAPGATATDMMKMNPNIDLSRSYIPSKRASTTQEIANLALFLVSDMGKNMCGEVIVFDGGESLK